MKRIRDRPLTPLLKQQLAEQEKRIKQCGLYAESRHTRTLTSAYSTIYSLRSQRCSQPLRLTHIVINNQTK